MRKALAVVGVASSLLFCTQANAVTVTYEPGVNFLPGMATENFSELTLGQTGSYSTAFASFAGTGVISQGTTPNVSAAPFINPGVPDPGLYLAVTGTETVTFSTPKTEFGLYWGSVDSYNSISFNFNGPGTTGTDVSPLIANGAQTTLTSAGYILFTDLAPFTTVTISSSTPAFEIADLQTNGTSSTPPVPEASTWMMMILGFFSLGFVAYRRKGRAMQFRIA
jgi:hypothetical protein